MLAGWLASREAKSSQQNILHLCTHHTINNWDNRAFWKVFMCVNQLSLQSVMTKHEFYFVLNEWMHEQIKIIWHNFVT